MQNTTTLIFFRHEAHSISINETEIQIVWHKAKENMRRKKVKAYSDANWT